MPWRSAFVTNSDTTSSAASASAGMSHSTSVSRVKFRLVLTDSGRGPSRQVAVGWGRGRAFPAWDGDAWGCDGSRRLTGRTPGGAPAVRKPTRVTPLTSVVTDSAARCAVIGFPSVSLTRGRWHLGRALAAQALSSPVYLANARPN